VRNNTISEQEGKTIYHKDIKIIAKGAGVNFFGEVVGGVLMFLLHFIMARSLPIEHVGLFFLGLSVNRFAIIILTCGFGYGMIRYVSIFNQKKDAKRIKGTIFSGLIIALPLSIYGSLVIYFMADWMSITFFKRSEVATVIRIMVFAIPFGVVSEILLSSIQAIRIMKYKVYVKRLLTPFFEIIIFIVLFLFGFGLTSAAIAYTFSFVLGSFFVGYYFRKNFAIFGKKIIPVYNFKELSKFSTTRLFSQVLIFLVVCTDTFMIAHFLTPQDVGVYNIVGRLILFGTLISYSFASIFAPIISSLYSLNALKDLGKHFKIVTKWAFTLSLPYYLLLLLLPEYALNIFGEGYVVGTGCLAVLSIAHILDTLTGPTSEIINMTGRPFLNFCNDFGTFIFNIVLNAYLIPRYGIFGAAVASSFSIIIINVARIIEVYYILRIQPYNTSYFKTAFSCLILTASLFSLQHFVFPYCNTPIIAILICACLGLYFLSIRLLRLEEEDYIVLNMVRKKLNFSTVERNTKMTTGIL
jgi:O-antigen/teichoic acid export membrane protein